MSTPVHECDIVIGLHYGLFYYVIYISTRGHFLALYPHDVNKFVLAVSYFMWLWFYLNSFISYASLINITQIIQQRCAL
jgi:hypothetical protein